MADYVIAGNAAVDKITYADGTSTGFLPGGATLFALTGIQLWSDSVLMCGGFGADYMDHMGDWMIRNHIDRRAFNVRDEKNPLNYMIYKDDGEWTSYTEYGDAHYDSLDCDPQKDHLADYLNGTKGVYCFRGEDENFFAQITELKKQFQFRLMWEIKGTLTVPEKLPFIKKTLKNVDAFSINKTEAQRLWGVEQDKQIIQKLKELELALIVYRVGAKGLYIVKDQKEVFVPSVKKFPVVDVTGCGNSSTSAAFYAWCQGMDSYAIGACANVTAAINLKYQGAMELTEENRKLAQREWEELVNKRKEKGEKD